MTTRREFIQTLGATGAALSGLAGLTAATISAPLCSSTATIRR